GVIGLGMAIDYLIMIGIDTIRHHEEMLTTYALEQLQKVRNITLYGPKNTTMRSGVISFTLEGIHSHDIATLLDREGICVRGGHHCAMPLMKKLGITGSTRVSFSIYNTKDDVDRLVQALGQAQKVFRV
ncbi:MAG: aminotransferase class V-fold PLP-dependent enzyme, partial [Nanoarchaeota archaeon]